MAFRIEIDPLAAADIEEIRDWIAERSPARATVWQDRLLEAIATMASFPRRCPRALERDDYPGEVRKLLYGRRSQFRVLFGIEGEVVRVLAVLNSAGG